MERNDSNGIERPVPGGGQRLVVPVEQETQCSGRRRVGR